jgi:hyaluronoglucosaminidase
MEAPRICLSSMGCRRASPTGRTRPLPTGRTRPLPTRRTRPLPTGRTHRWMAAVAVPTLLLVAGCSIVPTPGSAPVTAGIPVPDQAMGYVVCPNSVTPVELATHTAEPPIPLPVEGTPALGSFAVATAPDGRAAYVVTQTTPTRGTTHDVVIPIDLVTQRAGRPIVLPGAGSTHAVVVLHDGVTVLAAVGTTIVPVDSATRAVGTPLNLGVGHTVDGMALSPTSSMLYALVPDAVIPVDTATAKAGVPIATGLGVSSESSPHGVVVSDDGSTVYVVGQGGSDFGGRLAPIATATGTVGTVTSFDQFGLADPAAVALTADGSKIFVADSANNWVVPVSRSRLGTPSTPVKLPTGDPAAAGTDHPSDIVTGPGTTGEFVVTGLDTVLPFAPAAGSFGTPIRVCAGASSMAVTGGAIQAK